MTSGPAHYAEAERLEESACQSGLDSVWVMARLARAQVHATLALAAATIDTSNRRVTDADEWAEVTG